MDLWVPVSKVPNVFDYLAGQTATPQPVVTGLSVNPDPRLQLGDVVTIRSEKFLGIQLTVLIVGMDRSGGPDGYSQDLTVKVLDAKALSQTYHEFGASMLGVAVVAIRGKFTACAFELRKVQRALISLFREPHANVCGGSLCHSRKES